MKLIYKSELISKIYFLIFHIILFIPWLEKYHLKMDSTNQNLEVVYNLYFEFQPKILV